MTAIVAFLLCLAGCAISVGGPSSETTVVGLLHVARTTNGETITVERQVLGADVRASTHDAGVTIGYSRLTVVFPRRDMDDTPSAGFCWPLGYAWMDRTGCVLHELGWITTRVPAPGDVRLTHYQQLGAGCTLGSRSAGIAVGYRDRVRVQIECDRNAVYTVRYESQNPFKAAFTANHGGS